MLPLGLRLELGRAMRDPGRALPRLEAVVNRYPRHAAGWLHLGLARLSCGMTAEAEDALARADQCEPRNPAFPVFRAIARLDSGDPAGARALLDEALRRDGGNVLAQQCQALCTLAAGDSLAALQTLKKEPVLGNSLLVERLMVEVEKILVDEEGPIELVDEEERDLLLTATDVEGSVPPSQAEFPQEAVPAAASTAPEAAPSAGEGVASDVPPAEAVPAQAEVPPGPELPPYFHLKPHPMWESLFYTRMWKDIQARWYFSRAQKLAEQVQSETRISVDDEVANSPRLAQAIGFYEAALTLDPGLSRGFFFLGEAAFLARRYELARQALERSRQDDDDTFLNLYYLGRIARLEGRLKTAEQYLSKAVDAFEKFPEALLVLGQIAVRKGDLVAARRYLRQAAQLDMFLVRDRVERAIDHVGQRDLARLSSGNNPATE